MELLAHLILGFIDHFFLFTIFEVGIDSIEIDSLFTIFDQIHELIILKSSVFGMITPYLESYPLDVGLSRPLVFDCL